MGSRVEINGYDSTMIEGHRVGGVPLDFAYCDLQLVGGCGQDCFVLAHSDVPGGLDLDPLRGTQCARLDWK